MIALKGAVMPPGVCRNPYAVPRIVGVPLTQVAPRTARRRTVRRGRTGSFTSPKRRSKDHLEALQALARGRIMSAVISAYRAVCGVHEARSARSARRDTGSEHRLAIVCPRHQPYYG